MRFPTPHPARFPMKCIGTAGHPLPKGEGCSFTSNTCCRAIDVGDAQTLPRGQYFRPWIPGPAQSFALRLSSSANSRAGDY
jgi:hypothetical protein